MGYAEASVGPASIGVNNPLPVAQNLPGGVIGTAYSETVTVSQSPAQPPYMFAVISGSLPAGLGLNGATGVISGTPTTAATYSFTIPLTDANGNTGTQNFQIIVATPSSGGQTAYAFVG
jgi:hypothetical protein